MKVFTVRELDREPSAVLDECDRQGGVKIRRRDGRMYTVRPDVEPRRITKVPDLAARVHALFPKPIPAAQIRMVDKLIGGE